MTLKLILVSIIIAAVAFLYVQPNQDPTAMNLDNIKTTNYTRYAGPSVTGHNWFMEDVR